MENFEFPVISSECQFNLEIPYMSHGNNTAKIHELPSIAVIDEVGRNKDKLLIDATR